jgi:hypothetical protein
MPLRGRMAPQLSDLGKLDLRIFPGVAQARRREMPRLQPKEAPR